MAGLKKKGPKHRKENTSKRVSEKALDLTKEDIEFKKMMEDAHVYKRSHGALRRVR